MRRDDGQMMVSLVIALSLSLLFFLAVALFPLGAATNEKTRSRTAADAAALGGAEEIRMQWVDISTRPGLLMYPLIPLPPVFPGSGSAGASSYAASNDARVALYYATPPLGQVYARVKNTYAYDSSRGYATSEATAEMDIDFTSCMWTNPVPPAPVWNGGPPLFDRTIRCGAWSASYVIANSTPLYPTVKYTSGDTRDGLFDDLEPRLID